MIRRRTILTTALAASAALGLAACSEDGSDPEATSAAAALAGVTISEDLETEPIVEFTAPLDISAPDSKVVVAGDGETIAEGDLISWRSLYVDASTGEVLQSSWQGAPAEVIAVTSDGIGAAAFAFLTTVTVGSRIAMAGWQQSTSGQAYSLIQVADIDRIIPGRAEGEAVAPSGDFPAVTLAENGAPSLAAAPEGEPPTATTVEMLIRGTGEPTAAGDSLTMMYTGWSWDTGEQFDSSWDRGAPFTFVQGQGQVIAGWDEHLLDIPVGSQVMLVIPPVDGYGEEPSDSNPLGGQTLLFVIDVLNAQPAAS